MNRGSETTKIGRVNRINIIFHFGNNTFLTYTRFLIELIRKQKRECKRDVKNMSIIALCIYSNKARHLCNIV